MSIIEKAAGRLPRTSRKPIPQPQAASPDAQIAEAVVADRAAIPDTGRRSAKLVELDLAKLREAGMVTPNAARSSVAEEFRAIKRTLLLQAFEQPRTSSRPNNLIMVTSSVPGEGKTFCSVNLAISIAMELDRTVLLVDADVARPSIPRLLGLPPAAGLMDVLLSSDLDLADVLLRTNVDTLSILPAGSSHRNATELLASQAMVKLLHELANRYPDRVVLFDSPPLLLTTEARVLAHQMGQIVVVVEAEKTSQRTLQHSLRHLEGCSNVSLIYNKAKSFSGEDAYGYYYTE